ncbi:MAG: hypothetical protein RJA07_1520 [Bacteroidota bacterium]|jgi:iron complex outermembrane receptor protein
MQKLFLSVVAIFISINTFSQNTFKAIIKDAETNQPLMGATAYIQSTKQGAVTDTSGIVIITNVPTDTFKIECSFIGYEKTTLAISASNYNHQIIEIYLKKENTEIETIVIASTRTNSRIENVPVKMEVIALDEIEEMTGINPTNVSMLLTEASGVQQQITSATSGNVNARIYGLDGQYTQIVKDGFPMFSGYSSGFNIMQIAPLDLKQIEIIKGAASALYGGDAIAGVMNLVSKSTTFKKDFSVILNQTQKLGTDIDAYYSKRNKKFGIAFLATQNFQQPIDVNGDNFTDIPKTNTTTISPKLFFYPSKKTTASLLLNATFDNRIGGDIIAIKSIHDSLHSYFDKNTSQRFYSQFKFEKTFNNHNQFTVKNGLSYFNRTTNTGKFGFGGIQTYSYTELSYFINLQKNKIVFGSNCITDQFAENQKLNTSTIARNYNYYTIGFFAQDDWSITPKAILQLGTRTDYQNKYKLFFLPRASFMYKFKPNLTARLGTGFGYKAPTIFSTGYEENALHNVRPLSATTIAENSIGINGDVNYKRYFKQGSINFNQAFFFTQINSSLIPQNDSLLQGVYYFINATKPLQTQGTETNIRIVYKGLTLHTGYTYTDAIKTYAMGNQQALFVAKHKVIMDAFYELEKWNVGLEAFHTGKQYIGNNQYGRGYWHFACMIAYKFKSATLLLNIENFADQRQTRWEQVVLPPYTNPTFKPIYAPLNGIIANLSLRVKL